MLAKALARRPDRRQGSVIAVVLLAIAALAVGVLAQANPAAAPSASAGGTAAANATAISSPNSSHAAGQSSTTVVPSASAEPTASPEPWTPVEVAPLAAVATLRPSGTTQAGIPADATFDLASLTAEPARAVGTRLEVTPAIAFTVAETADPASATIRPSEPLAAGQTYRFLLRNADQTLAGSWAFRVRGPVQVTSTIPGNATTDVPVRTGIEVTFDQDGVADMADHFSIQPSVKGTFERHGRTQVFVPSSLADATTYTVTIRKGLARTGTDLSLEADVVFRFETRGDGDQEPRLHFAREAIESGPGQPLTIAVEAIRPWVSGERAPAPTSAHIWIYQLPTLEAASRALNDLLAAPHWTQYTEPLIPTRGLKTVADFTAPLEPLARDILSVRVPVTLHAGWYVLEIPGTRRSQAFLQVTPVSAWVSVLTDRTVVWVNDVTTHSAIEGATVAVGASRPFARSDADGLAVATTPAALVPPAAGGDPTAGSPVLRVTSVGGQVVLVPFNVRGDTQAYRGEWWEMFGSADETYWSLLYTDREMYRRTDRIELWGYLRGRDDGTVPARVRLQLVTSAQGPDAEVTTLATTDARPGLDGSFRASLPVSDLPLDSYAVQAVVDGRVVMSRWVEVTIIRKPPYRLEVASEPAAVITGTPVTVTARATFFDGTPVARLPIMLTGDEGVPQSRLTTDAAGQATITLETPTSSTAWQDWRWLHVQPAGPESADISAGAEILIFPSGYDIDGTGTLKARHLTFSGKLTEVDLARVRRALAAGSWDGDPSGRAVANATVRATITELVPVRHQVGAEYDFVDKVVRPIYEYDFTYKVVRTVSVRSGADGAIRFSLAVPSADHDYQIQLSTHDRQGHLQERTAWAHPAEPATPDPGVRFVTDDGKPVAEPKFGVGDRISWRMVDGGRDLPSHAVDRYLYVVAQRGLRAAIVTDTPRFGHTFAAADAPGIFVMGIRFNGTTYAPKAASWANFEPATRAIDVEVHADHSSYRPGGTARLSVTTTDPRGEPVAATVVLQVVDQKLYAMGGASAPRPLEDLYGRVDSGIVRLTATHQVPSMAGPEGEGGDTTGGGGGERSDFKDTLVFRELRTDATGSATTTIHLSDDLTSWHVSAAAVTGELAAGVGELLLPVGLPFFVEPTLADSYLASDRPVIQVRAYGDALRAEDPVEFTVSSPSLGLAAWTVRGTAFEPVDIPLPALVPGTPSITIRGVAPTRFDAAGRPLADTLTRSFEVVASRLTASTTAYGLLADGLPSLPAGAERATWTFTDTGRGRLLTWLSGLAESSGVRLDGSIAQSNARRVLVDAFGRDPASFSPSDVDLSLYPIGQLDDSGDSATQGGVALVPYGSLDPWLAARVALLAPDTLPVSPLRDALESIRDGSITARDLRIAAIAGLAGLGEPMLEDLLAAARQPDLTPTERLYLALGFEAVGDDASALAQERALLADSGERLGTWVRLRVARTADQTDATALLAVVAATLGDPIATDLADYAAGHPATDTLNALELEAYAERALARTPSAAASLAYTIGGRRSVVRLGPGEAFTLQLTAAQAASMSVESLTGRVGVVLEARVPIAPASLQEHPDLTLTRGGLPQPIPSDGVVEVNLTATFAEGAIDGCYDVVEVVPSGLAPLPVGRGRTDETGITWPTSVVGQEVRFCASNDPSTGRVARLRYEARVVNEGTFTWEPAVMQYPGAPELQASTPPWTATIGAP